MCAHDEDTRDRVINYAPLPRNFAGEYVGNLQEIITKCRAKDSFSTMGWHPLVCPGKKDAGEVYLKFCITDKDRTVSDGERKGCCCW